MKQLLLLVFCTFLVIQPCRALGQGNGQITGVVLDVQGNPLIDATITIRSIGFHRTKIRVPVKTDLHGNFVGPNCEFGDYVLAAVNDQPTSNTNAATPSNNAMATVSLSPSFPNAVVTLMFGQDVATITGRIKDDVTGQPVNAKLELQSLATGRTLISAGLPSDFRVMVPRNSDLALRISAPGYQPWYYNGEKKDSASSGTAQVEENQKRVSVSMRPLHK